MSSDIKLYPTLPSAPPDATYQEQYHINTIREEFDELSNLKSSFHEKYTKYKKILRQLFIVNASSSALSIGTGIGAIATSATVVGIPISIALGGLSLGGAFSTGVSSALIKKYQQKVSRNNKLYDMITSAIAVFEITVSESLNNGTLINENEFNKIQGVYFKTLRDLATTDRKLKKIEDDQLKKDIKNELENLKKIIKNSS